LPEPPVAAVLGVLLQHGVGRGSGAGEGVEHDGAPVRGDLEDALQKLHRLGGDEHVGGVLEVHQAHQFFLRVLRVPGLLVGPDRLWDHALLHFGEETLQRRHIVTGGTAKLGHHHHGGLPGEQLHDEPRHAHWLLGAQRLRQRLQPLGDRGGVIVDNVVDTAAAVLDRRRCRLRGVGDVDERPYAATVADQRELAPADHLG
jgi:hypothetical protein